MIGRTTYIVEPDHRVGEELRSRLVAFLVANDVDLYTVPRGVAVAVEDGTIRYRGYARGGDGWKQLDPDVANSWLMREYEVRLVVPMDEVAA